jgi:hypothetical protein
MGHENGGWMNDDQRSATRLTERQAAILLANRLLDEPNADPDDDLRILAQQFMRANDRVSYLESRIAKAEDIVNALADLLADLEDMPVGHTPAVERLNEVLAVLHVRRAR